MVRIEPLRLNHLIATARVFARTLQPVSSREVADHLLYRKGSWVAVVDGKVAGFYTAVAFVEQKTLWLDLIGVNPDARTHGVGRALIAHLEAQGRAHGFSRVELSVLRNNTGAIAFYTKLGYAQAPEQKLSDRYCLYRDLDSSDVTYRPELFGSRAGSNLITKLVYKARKALLSLWVISALKSETVPAR